MIDLTAPVVDITFNKGSTLNPILYQPNNVLLKTDLTGYSAVGSIKSFVDSSVVLQLSTLTDTVIIKKSMTKTDDGSQELMYNVRLNIPATVTSTFTESSYDYGINLISPDNEVIGFVQGTLTAADSIV